MRVGRVRAEPILETRHKRRRAQRALAAGLAEASRARNIMLQEFQTFSAILREVTVLSAERAECLEELRLHQKGRFDALARVHAMLLRDGGSVDLETLVWDELESAIAPVEEGRITIGGPPVAFERRPAELIALLFHELSTNAVKFGAFAEDEGQVDVSWGLSSDGATFSLSWRESGAPVSDRLPTRCGFGRELVETILPRRLGARTRLTLSGSGLRCEIELPLSSAVDDRSPEMAVAA